jgi:hypothetical protein
LTLLSEEILALM